MRRDLILLLAPLILLAIPLLRVSDFWMHTLIIASYYALLAISWDLLLGYTGLLSLGHMGMVIIGAYSSVFLTAPATGYIGGPPFGLGLPKILGLPLGGVAAAAAGLALGVITLRMRGAYLALATLGFAEIIREIFNREHQITRGALGMTVYPVVDVEPEVLILIQYYIAFAILYAGIVSIQIMMRSRIGLYLRATRDDPEAAEAMGVDTVRWKIFSFVVASFIAGVAGAFYAQYVGSITPRIGRVDQMGAVIAMTIIGGAGTTYGPLLGAYILTVVLQVFRELGPIRLVAFGFFIVLVMRFFPSGLWGFLRLVYSKLGSVYRRVPAFPQAHPSPKSENNQY